MGRPKSKKTADENGGEVEEHTVEGELVNKALYERAVSKWKSESCYHFALRNSKSVASSKLLHVPKDIPSSSKTTLFSWLSDHGLIEGVENKSNSLQTITLVDGSHTHIIQPWRSHVSSRTSSASSSSGDGAPGSSELIDLHINAGGPIWSATFAPTALGANVDINDNEMFVNNSLDKYIAVGVSQVGHRVEDGSGEDNHVLGHSETHSNLIQVWRVHGTYTHPKKAKFPTKPIPAYLLKKKADEDPNRVVKPKGRPRKYPKVEAAGEAPTPTPATPTPTLPAEPLPSAMEIDDGVEGVSLTSDVAVELVYCVALQARGPSWSCVWSPLASPASSKQLGLLAVVNGDGSCLILQLPKSLSSSRARGSGGEEAHRRDIPVVTEAAVTLREISVPGFLVCSVAWSTENPFLFSCGMSDGSLMVWDLNKSSTSEDTLLSAPQRHLEDLLVLESQVPSMAAVRALQFSPYDSNLIISCGQEDMKIWSLKDSSGPVFRKAALSTTAAIAWDPSGYGYYFGDSETTSLTWNPLWGFGLRSLFRKELYTHHDISGGMWSIDAFISEGHSFVLTAASDGSVRGGYPSLMTSFKQRNASALQLGRIRSVVSSADGTASEVRVENNAHILVSAIGSETFPQSSEMAVHSIHSTHLGNPPTLSAELPAMQAASAPPTATKKTYQKKARVVDSDSDGDGAFSASAAKSAKKKTPSKKAAVQLSDESEAELEDTSSDSEVSDVGPKSTGKKAKVTPKKKTAPQKEKETPRKSQTVAPVVDLVDEGPQLASLRLVAYGGQAGLLRIHSFDPLRLLIAPAPGK